jgi:hypothetical protein
VSPPSALGYSTGPAVIWSAASAQEATQRLGRAVLIHPGFPLLRIETPTDAGVRAVRVVHALPDGGNLTITQAPVAEGQPTPAPPLGGSTIIRSGLVVTGIGPISADSIAALLQALR